MKKKLFIIKHNGKPVKGEVYDLKMEAKASRDALGGVEKGFCVSKGPDHIGNHGHRYVKARGLAARKFQAGQVVVLP